MYRIILFYRHLYKYRQRTSSVDTVGQCRKQYHTFRLNIKSSLLKLLCTLARLCEGTPFQPLRLNFLSHPRSTLRIAIFCRHDNRTRGKACIAHMSALLSPTSPTSPTSSTPRHRYPPPTSYLSPAKVSCNSAPRHFALPRTAGRMFPLRRAKYFLRALTLFFPLLFPRTAFIHHTHLRR